MGSFDYVITDSQQNVLALRSHEWEKPSASSLQDIVSSDQMLSAGYRNVRLGWAVPEQTLIPNRLFRENQAAVYLGQSAKLTPAHTAWSDELGQMELHNVYALPQDWREQAQNAFPGSRQYHICSALLQQQRAMGLQQPQPAVFVHLRGNVLIISAFDRGALRFCNSFTYHSARDFIYYVMLAYEQAGLKPKGALTYLSGPIVEDSEIYRQISRYVPQLQFAVPPAFFHFGPELKAWPAYFFFDLLSLSRL